MNSFSYVVTPRGRISAGKSVGAGNLKLAHEVLPGTTIRGALAAAWWRDRSQDFPAESEAQAALDKLFERSLVIRPAVPSVAGHPAGQSILRGCSERRCKYHVGKDAASWADQALSYLSDPNVELPRHCACDGSFETGKGWETRQVATVIRTSLRLDKDGRAEDHHLFARQSVEREAIFNGQILLRPKFSLDTKDIEWLQTPIRVRIGGRRTVLGAATITVTSRNSPPVPAKRTDSRVVIRLLSPAIIVDEYGAPTFDVAPELRRLLQEPALMVERTWSRSTSITGWHMLSRLPRPLEWGLDAGSTFLVAGVPADKWQLLEFGIGLRTGEGYGAVQVFDDGPIVDARADDSAPAAEPNTVSNEPEPAPEHEHEHEPDPAPVPAQLSLVAQFVATLPAEDRLPALNGARAEMRLLKGLPEAGQEFIRANKAQTALSYPWASRLSKETRDAIEDLILHEPNPGEAETELAGAILIEEGK